MTRKDFVSSLFLGLAGTKAMANATNNIFNTADAFTLPNLPFAYNALEPFIDAQTMEIHHS